MAVVLFTSFIGCAEAKVAVGDTPPDDLGKNRQGDEVRISDYRGQVVVLTFWATWCDYCRKEMPILGGLQKAVGKNRLEVIAVDWKEDRRTYLYAARVMKQTEVTMTSDPRGKVGEPYGIQSLPHLFMVDKQGKVAHVHAGYGEDSLQEFVDEVNALLAQPYVPEPTPAIAVGAGSL